MKSKTAERILSETPQEVKDRVREYSNKLVNMKEDEVCIMDGIMFSQEGLDNLEMARNHFREFTHKLMFGYEK